jgi:hypothetical protein
MRGAGLPLHRGSVGAGRFLDGQDTSAYVAPAMCPGATSPLVAAPCRAVRSPRLRRLRDTEAELPRGG